MVRGMCICEICTCGRHRCPHKPSNLSLQDYEPCKVTEYNQRYQTHAIPIRESFKPREEPMRQTVPMDQTTTNRSDFLVHPVEQRYNRPKGEYRKPEGEMDMVTTNKQNFTGRTAPPAQAVIRQSVKQVPGKFEADTTSKSDYKAWDPQHRPQRASQSPWQPPTERFGGDTTQKSSYQGIMEPMRKSFKPHDLGHQSNEPLNTTTSHRADFQQHALPPRYAREKEQWKASETPMESLSTARRDFKGEMGPKMASCKPSTQAFQSDVPFDAGTTAKNDYRDWPRERPFQHAADVYKKPEGDVDYNTTHKNAYHGQPGDRVVAKRPQSSNRRSSARFDGRTTNQAEYRQWDPQARERPARKDEYSPNPAPFDGQSTQKEHFREQRAEPARSFKPTAGAYQSNAPFDPNTMYRAEFTKKQVDRCPVPDIDKENRFVFAETDSRGHKRYRPVYETVSRIHPSSASMHGSRPGLVPLAVA